MNDTTFNAAPERAVPLQAEQLMRVHGPAKLRVTRGTLWLTIDGQTDDHVLVAGDHFVLGRDAGAIVQAIFAPACAVIAEEAVHAWPQRAAQALRTARQQLAGVFA